MNDVSINSFNKLCRNFLSRTRKFTVVMILVCVIFTFTCQMLYERSWTFRFGTVHVLARKVLVIKDAQRPFSKSLFLSLSLELKFLSLTSLRLKSLTTTWLTPFLYWQLPLVVTHHALSIQCVTFIRA